jgi:hypothetical protein
MKFKGVEVLSETEQVLVFTRTIKGKEVGAASLINIVYYESKNEESWIFNDNIIQKIVEQLEAHKNKGV